MRNSSRFMVMAGRGALLLGFLLFGAAVAGIFLEAHATQGLGSAPSSAASAADARPASQMFARTLEPVTQSGPAQEPEAGPAAPGVTTASPSGSSLSTEVLGLVAEQAPFEADRREPGQRYRMPLEELPEREEPVELPPAPQFELVGVVSGLEGGLAVIRLEGGDLRMLSSGESLEGYTLAAVEADRAVMEGADRTLELPLATPSPTIVREDPDSQRRNRRTRGRNSDGSDQDTAAQFQSVQDQIIQRARDVMEQLGAQGGQIRLGTDGSIEVTRPNAVGPGGRPAGPVVVPYPQIRVPIDQLRGNR